MSQSVDIPSLEEFLACCDVECEFLVREYGFERLAEPREFNEFSVRFRKGDLEVHVYGENWGEAASCDLVKGGEELFLGLLVPAAERQTPKRRRRGPGPGQLAQIRVIATRLKQHASDVLRGDFARFDAALAEWKRITRPREVTQAHRLERQRQQALTAAGHASKRGDHAEVVRLLEPYADGLSPRQRRMLDAAREQSNNEAGGAKNR